MTPADERFMRRALALAARGGTRTAPNPLVGAVVVQGGRIVGEGYHRRFGGPHAEVHALRAAGARSRRATLYSTLEPCSPHPKLTPPCTDLICRSGIARVVVALRDPNPQVDGRGISLLRRAGIEVTTGVLAQEAREQNAAFVKVQKRGLPYVAVKWAMTLDGKIASPSGDSRWISNERSRAWLKRWRDTFHAILIGRGTLVLDDPLLRGANSRPARIILDSSARTSSRANVVRTAREQPTILAVAPGASPRKLRRLRNAGVRILETDPRNVQAVLAALAREGLHRILVEGGGEVHASVLDHPGLADEACVFVSPKIIGGRTSKSPVEGTGLRRMSDALRLKNVSIQQFAEDVMIRGRFQT